jgi:hypothetical protein
LTRKQLQRGVHRSGAELEAEIATVIAAHSETPKPYIGQIRQRNPRVRQTLLPADTTNPMCPTLASGDYSLFNETQLAEQALSCCFVAFSSLRAGLRLLTQNWCPLLLKVL